MRAGNTGFIDSLKEKELRIFLIISLTVFSVLPTLFYFEIVQDSGKGIVQMILLYILGRYIRMYRDISPSKWKCLAALLLLWCLNTISILHPIQLGGITHSLCRDNSITNIAIMVLLFYIFKSIDISSRFINRLTANIFAVFALENASTHILAQFMADYELRTSGTFTALLLAILMVFGIFLVNCLIGMIRELLLGKADHALTTLILKPADKIQSFIPHL